MKIKRFAEEQAESSKKFNEILQFFRNYSNSQPKMRKINDAPNAALLPSTITKVTLTPEAKHIIDQNAIF